MSWTPEPRTPSKVAETLRHARKRPAMYWLRTHEEATALIVGIDIGTGLFPAQEMTDWLHSGGDAKWGGRGGVGWPFRVARVALWGQLDHPDGAPAAFTPADQEIMRDAVLDFAIRWIERADGPLQPVDSNVP